MLFRAIRRLAGDARLDVAHAGRQMRRTPTFTAVVVATLAFGIGANVTMAGVIDQLLFRPPPFVRDPARVVRLVQVTPLPGRPAVVSTGANYPMLLDLERAAPAFASVAAVSIRETSLGTGADARPVRAALVSASYFPTLGTTPVVGRMFGPADGFPRGAAVGGPMLAVLSYDLWQQRYGGTRQVLGAPLRVGTATYTVVGVTPAGFRGTDDEPPDLWLPMTAAAGHDHAGLTLEDRGAAWLSIVARLGPGASAALGAEQAAALWRRAASALGGADAGGRMQVVAAPLVRGRGPDAPPEARTAVWVGGVSTLVLLIACANVATLLLGRAYTRRREMGVRVALGAPRARLARQVLAESVALAGLGGVAAIGLAALGGRLLGRWLHLASSGHAFVNARVFAFTAAVALGTGVVVGLAPALQQDLQALTAALRTGAAGGGTRAGRVRWSLVAAQSALCMLLLVGAGLFALSLRRVVRLDLGLDVDHTLRAQFDLDGVQAPHPAVAAIYQDMLRRVQAVPGVRRAALAENDPYSGGRAVAIHTPEHDARYFWWTGSRGTYAPVPIEAAVDTGFFRTVGATSLRGRDFTAVDVRGGERVTILNAPLAALLFEGREALGQCVYLPPRADVHGGPCYRVVGVTHGFWQNSILARDKLAIFVPLAQHVVLSDGLGRPRSLFVAVRGDPDAVAPAIRVAIQGVRPDLPAVRVTPVRDLVARQTTPWRLATTVLLLFGGVALVTAGVGLYAVVAFAARQRAAEIAVRLALGARGRDVFRLLTTEGLSAVAAGVGVGTGAAVVVGRWLGPLLFQTPPTDPGVIAATAAVLTGVALTAVAVPVVTATRQDIAGLFRKE